MAEVALDIQTIEHLSRAVSKLGYGKRFSTYLRLSY
jgi:hypothetical protein